MKWTRQGEAVISPFRLVDGCAARAVLMGPRTNPKGAVVVAAQGPDEIKTFPLSALLDRIPPQDLVEILCMQERVFGSTGLSASDIA